MKFKNIILCLALATQCLGQMQEKDWQSFISKQDLTWTKLPLAWDEGPILGNGMMGSYIIYEPKQNAIRFEVCRADVQDHRTKKSSCGAGFYMVPRLMIGNFLLKPLGEIKGGSMRLNLYDAEANGKIITSKGEISFRVYTHTEKMCLVVETKATGEEKSGQYIWNAAIADSPRQIGGQKCDGYVSNPAPIIDTTNKNAGYCLQKLLEGGQTATIWDKTDNNNESRLLISVAHTYPDSNSLVLAKQYLAESKAVDANSFFKSHKAWWNKYYQKSFLSIPDKKLESFYWIQLYKLGSITRADRILIDCPSLWVVPTAWPLAWWNLNVQLTYWPVNASNHADLNGSLTNTVFKNMNTLIQNVSKPYQFNSAGVARATSYDMKGNVGIPNNPDPRKGPEIGLLPWTCHNIYLHYRYTMDKSLLNPLYDVLRRSINYYLHFLKKEEDGKWHLPSTYSPEYGSTIDCNFDLSILRWGCQTLLTLNKQLNKQDTLVTKWNDVLTNLTPYPQDSTGLRIGKDQPYDMSHRHFSHLLMVYPFYTMNIEQEGAADLIKKTKEYWQSKPKALAGYSHTGASSIESALGNGNQALIHLQNFMTNIIRPNTLYKEGKNPVIETPLSGAQAILDMLLQSWGNKIRVFPAVPDAWQDVSYDKLLAEGAFEISAKKVKGKTVYIKIKSLAGEPCVLVSEIQKPVSSNPQQTLKLLKKNEYQIDLKKGEEITIYAKDAGMNPTIAPIEGNWGSFFGLN